MLRTALRCSALAAAFVGAVDLAAQTEASLTHYTVQPTLINPALSGFDGEHAARLNYRAAAAGLPDGPQTYSLSYSGAVAPTFGVGAQVFADDVARLHTYGARLAYAFRTRLNGDIKVAAGFATTFLRSELRPGASGEFDYDPGDPELAAALDGQSAFEASLGFHARHVGGTYADLVLPTLVGAHLGQADGVRAERGGPDNFILRVGHEIVVAHRNFRVTPSAAVLRVHGAPTRIDVNATAGFLDDRFVAGLGYRAGAGSDVGVLLGMKIDKVRAYYSYDVSFGEFQRYHSGGHELTLGFDFKSRARYADSARYE